MPARAARNAKARSVLPGLSDNPPIDAALTVPSSVGCAAALLGSLGMGASGTTGVVKGAAAPAVGGDGGAWAGVGVGPEAAAGGVVTTDGSPANVTASWYAPTAKESSVAPVTAMV
jgi:hypothetical protein